MSIELSCQVIQRASATASAVAASGIARAQTVLAASPALRIFVYTSATLSVVPLGIFGVYVGMTLLGTVLSAGNSFFNMHHGHELIGENTVIGALLVEGGLVLVGLSILVPVEGAILGIAGATALTYASSGVGMGLLGGLSQRVFEWTGIPVHRLLLQAGPQERPQHDVIEDRSWNATQRSGSSSSSKRGWREETRQVLRVHQVLESLDGEHVQEHGEQYRQRVSPPRIKKRSGTSVASSTGSSSRRRSPR